MAHGRMHALGGLLAVQPYHTIVMHGQKKVELQITPAPKGMGLSTPRSGGAGAAQGHPIQSSSARSTTGHHWAGFWRCNCVVPHKSVMHEGCMHAGVRWAGQPVLPRCLTL